MGQSNLRGAVSYEVEASFGEDVDTTATLRLPVLGSVDPSGLRHDKSPSELVTQRRNDGALYILMTMGGSFKTRLYLTGHGSATSGATSAGLTETLIGRVFGNTAAAAAAGTTFTGGTSTAPTTAASATFSAGALMRAGTLNDGRGNGQFYAISTHPSNTMNLLTAMDAAPNNGDVCYSSVLEYVSEAPTSTSITGLRFSLQTADLMYVCHGCVPTAVQFSSLKAGEKPWIEVTWEVAWWEYSTATFPTATATESFQPAPIAGGTLQVQDVGTTTRNKRGCRDLTIDYKLGVELLHGYGGVSQYQTLVGAVRTPDEITVAWTEDADAATLTPVLPVYGTTAQAKYLLATLNPVATKAVGIFLPNVCIENVPTQFNDNGINRLRISGKAYTGTTTTNDLTASAFRMAFA